QRGQDIARICQSLEILARKKSNIIKVDCRDNRISFGEAGRFGHNQYFLDPQGQQALQDVVPLILDVTDSPEGQRWMKQVVVEGFTD
ncbi:hypothetical protein OFN21_29575, partial [Escherichia coli]|nr:hypothetical protein [Escherichia coli]